ncbi:MAG: lipid A export permease/ATP-binding protein MsbA [Burkholderiales bacterium]|nr:lipid A export permease/ATP-binding protein MsbA [Burkholderiales bacterium]
MNSRELYFRLLSYLRPHLGIFSLSIVGMIIMAATESAFPALVQLIIYSLDDSYPDKQFWQLAREWIPPLAVPAILIGLFVLRGLATLVSNYSIDWVGTRLVMDLRKQMFSRLLALPNRYFNEHATGNLISKLTFDVTQVTSAATKVVTIGVKDSLTIIGLLVYLFLVSKTLTLTSMAVAPIMAIIVRVMSRRLRGVSRESQRAMGDITSVLEESIENQRVVKVFGAQAYETRRFTAAINRVRQAAMKQTIASALNAPIIELLAACALALIMAIAYGHATEDKTSAGEFIGFIIGMMLLFPPLKRLTSVNEPLQRGLAAAESVFELIDETPETDTGRLDLGRAKGRIAFDRVSFRYPPDLPLALDDVRLVIEPGETIALVGASGSGKTTFASLIPRFFHPTAGCIFIDGYPLEDITLTSLRANIALVSQDVLLFNDTVAANIAYGRLADTPEEKVIAAAEAAHAMEFIRQMPEGMQTELGENGVRLSGGQRQRLAIARALLKDAPILILDEATSALDSASERHVQAALETLMRGRTTIVIAHRLSTIERANRIVVLDHGRVAEIGSHRELIARNGPYAHLHLMQRMPESGVVSA